jgi:hypothetical protein
MVATRACSTNLTNSNVVCECLLDALRCFVVCCWIASASGEFLRRAACATPGPQNLVARRSPEVPRAMWEIRRVWPLRTDRIGEVD